MLRARQRGFSLVEIIVAMVVSMIVVGFMAMFLTTPVDAYFAQSRRADLTDSADAIVRNISRDVRAAVPDSIRVSADRRVVEMLNTADVLRYRSSGESGNPARDLDTTQPDSQFSTVTRLDNLSEPFASNTHYLVVNHANTPGASAFELANVITPLGTVIAITPNVATGEEDITINPAFRFTTDSPTHSLFIVTGAVAYICDLATRTLRRYSGYTLAPSLNDRDTHAELVNNGATVALIAENLTACDIDYLPATPNATELVGVRMTLGRNGEIFPLYHQTPVERRP
jgi:MSHA biogenesis protein MshO